VIARALRPHARRPRRARGLSVLLATLLTAGCAGGRFVRPAGAAAPFPEGVALWEQLSQPCRDVSSAQTQLRVSGQIGRDRFPGLTTGLAVDAGRLAIEARHSSRRIFSLAGDTTEAVLLDHMQGRVVRGAAADIVEALVGVRLTPERLLAVLSGCVSPRPLATAADRIGALARLTTADSTIYLTQQGGQWRLRAAEFGDIVADYRRVDVGRPLEVELRSGLDIRLTVRVIEFVRNPQLPAGLFRLAVPDTFTPTSVETLRTDGPLAQRAPR